MTLSQRVCEVLRARVVLESEWLESKCLDRMYLNYVPQLQRVGGVVWYLRGHLGQRFASTASPANPARSARYLAPPCSTALRRAYRK
jgi:hypothetical protein